jgi:hypothetical protein
MFKKSLIIGSVTLMLLLVLAGCSNPTGSNGPQGRDGSLVIDTGTIDAATLAGLFDDVHIIKLGTGVASVDGVVPAGKTLQIAGPVPVTNNEVLTINGGTVHILETGALNISGTGDIAWTSGALVIEGDLVLDPANLPSFGTDNGFVPGWISFGPTGAVDLQGAGAVAGVIDGTFESGVPAVKVDNSGSPLQDLSAFPHWIPGRKLIVYDAHDTNEVLDLSGKGTLVVGIANRTGPTLTGDSLTIDKITNQGAFLVSRGGGNIIVDKDASLILDENGWLPGNIPITVYGKLSADNAVVIQEIPPSVDLSQGTLTAETTATPTFTFGYRGVNIARIELPDTSGSITIDGVPLANNVRQPVILNVGSIVANAATPGATFLDLPAGTTTVDKIITTGTVGTHDLTIRTTANGHEADPPETVKTVFRPNIIAGSSDLVLIRGPRLELRGGPIDLSNRLVLDTDNLGLDWPAQLALIIGGSVSTRGDHLTLTDGQVLNTQLVNTGEVDISGTITFNRSAQLAKVIVSAPAVVSGRGTIAMGVSATPAPGSLVVNDDVTFSIKGFGVDAGVAIIDNAASAVTIADGKSITLGADTQFTVGVNLTLTEGQYKATGDVGIAVLAGGAEITTVDTADNGLTIGNNTDKITLFADGAAVATFTATKGFGANDAPVVFGKDGIVIPAGSASPGARLEVSGTGNVGEITVAGASAITLGTDATANLKGSLSLLDDALLTAADSTANNTYTAANGTTGLIIDTASSIPALVAADNASAGIFITTNNALVDGKFTSTARK